MSDSFRVWLRDLFLQTLPLTSLAPWVAICAAGRLSDSPESCAASEGRCAGELLQLLGGLASAW